MAKRPKPIYKVTGAILYIPESEAYKFGYEVNFQNHPILVYTKNGDLEEDALYGKVEEGFTVEDSWFRVPDHLIKQTYSLEEAREEFPELFL